MKRLKKRFIAWIVIGTLAILAMSFVLTINLIVIGTTADTIGDSFENTEACAVVLGAKVHEGGMLSDMLRDRMDAAIALYHEGKVSKLLLSGDNSGEWGEVTYMKAYAIAKGVSEEAILSVTCSFTSGQYFFRFS